MNPAARVPISVRSLDWMNCRPRPCGSRIWRHVLVQVADGNGAAAMMIVPGLEQLADELPLRIPRLGAAHLLDDILAAKRQQRVTNPPGPTLEAAQGLARRQRRASAPAPDREQGGEQFGPLRQDFLRAGST